MTGKPKPGEVWKQTSGSGEVVLLVLADNGIEDPEFPYRCLTLCSSYEGWGTAGEVDDWRLSELMMLTRIA